MCSLADRASLPREDSDEAAGAPACPTLCTCAPRGVKTLALAFAHPSSATVGSTLQPSLAEEHLHLFRPAASLLHKNIPTAVHARLCPRPFSYRHTHLCPRLSPCTTGYFYTAGGRMPGQEAAGNRRGAAGLPNFRCTLLAWLVCGRAWPVRDQETVPRVWRCGAHNGARAEGQPGGGEVRRSLTWQGSLSDQDHPAAHSEAGSESTGASGGSEAGCSIEDSGELAALAKHHVGADGCIPCCAGCDERVGLWFGGCNISCQGDRDRTCSCTIAHADAPLARSSTLPAR